MRTKRPALLLGTTLLAAPFAAADLPTPDVLSAALTGARDEAEWPDLTVADAARNLQTPEEALVFVRDGIANASYHGVFQGADGTLRTRSANPVDKALLLAGLLKAILLETTKLKKRGNEVVSVTLLDMLNQAFGPAADAPAELKMKWGLAVCATEARLVQGTSVNRLLLDADGGLARIKATDLLAGADLALANPNVPNAALARNLLGGMARGYATS